MKKLFLIVIFGLIGQAHADYFQAPDGSVHYLEHADVLNGWASRLPSGAIPISDSAASSIQASQAAAAAAAAALRPNKGAFISAMNTALGGIIAANNYAKAYPLFAPAFDANDWANASVIVQDALATNVINVTQYANIKAASLTYNIPLTLP